MTTAGVLIIVITSLLISAAITFFVAAPLRGDTNAIKQKFKEDEASVVMDRNRDRDWFIATMKGYVPREELVSYKSDVLRSMGGSIRDLESRIRSDYDKKIEALEKRIWIMENPPKWKKGDKIHDVVVTEAKCLKSVGIIMKGALSQEDFRKIEYGFTWSYRGIIQSTGEAVSWHGGSDVSVFKKKRTKKTENPS